MDLQRLQEAFQFACDKHRQQTRKAKKTPYIGHLMAVASLVMDQPEADTDTVVAALLHDAVEDQGGRDTLEEIRARFGERVAHIVDGCTDADRIPKPAWKQRKLDYLSHLPSAEKEVRLVSAADKVHNAREILADYRLVGEELWARFSARREETLWYYRSLADIFVSHGPLVLGQELQRTLRELEALIPRLPGDSPLDAL